MHQEAEEARDKGKDRDEAAVAWAAAWDPAIACARNATKK
jgi:hypothetical protein